MSSHFEICACVRRLSFPRDLSAPMFHWNWHCTQVFSQISLINSAVMNTDYSNYIPSYFAEFFSNFKGFWFTVKFGGKTVRPWDCIPNRESHDQTVRVGRSGSFQTSPFTQAELDAHEASLFSSLTGLGKRSDGVTKTKFVNLWTGWHRSLPTKNKMKSVKLLKMSLCSLCRIMLRWLWPNLFQEICYAVVTLPICLLLLFGNTSFRTVLGFVEVSWGIFL